MAFHRNFPSQVDKNQTPTTSPLAFAQIRRSGTNNSNTLSLLQTLPPPTLPPPPPPKQNEDDYFDGDEQQTPPPIAAPSSSQISTKPTIDGHEYFNPNILLKNNPILNQGLNSQKPPGNSIRSIQEKFLASNNAISSGLNKPLVTPRPPQINNKPPTPVKPPPLTTTKPTNALTTTKPLLNSRPLLNTINQTNEQIINNGKTNTRKDLPGMMPSQALNNMSSPPSKQQSTAGTVGYKPGMGRSLPVTPSTESTGPITPSNSTLIQQKTTEDLKGKTSYRNEFRQTTGVISNPIQNIPTINTKQNPLLPKIANDYQKTSQIKMPMVPIQTPNTIAVNDDDETYDTMEAEVKPNQQDDCDIYNEAEEEIYDEMEEINSMKSAATITQEPQIANKKTFFGGITNIFKNNEKKDETGFSESKKPNETAKPGVPEKQKKSVINTNNPLSAAISPFGPQSLLTQDDDDEDIQEEYDCLEPNLEQNVSQVVKIEKVNHVGVDDDDDEDDDEDFNSEDDDNDYDGELDSEKLSAIPSGRMPIVTKTETTKQFLVTKDEVKLLSRRNLPPINSLENQAHPLPLLPTERTLPNPMQEPPPPLPPSIQSKIVQPITKSSMAPLSTKFLPNPISKSSGPEVIVEENAPVVPPRNQNQPKPLENTNNTNNNSLCTDDSSTFSIESNTGRTSPVIRVSVGGLASKLFRKSTMSDNLDSVSNSDSQMGSSKTPNESKESNKNKEADKKKDKKEKTGFGFKFKEAIKTAIRHPKDEFKVFPGTRQNAEDLIKKKKQDNVFLIREGTQSPFVITAKVNGAFNHVKILQPDGSNDFVLDNGKEDAATYETLEELARMIEEDGMSFQRGPLIQLKRLQF